MSSDVHTKRRSDVHPDFFAAEAAGLRWLAAAGAPVVEVVSVAADRIDLRRLRETSPTRAAAMRFGAALSAMHDAGADHFGSPPDGFHGRTFVGSREQDSIPTDSWGEFYARTRVLAFVDPAVAAGNLTASDEAAVREACERIASGDLDPAPGGPDERPARLHGDLWTGNVLWTPDGVVMIDPAAHGGHRETDLAMLALFGCPLLDQIIDGYQSRRPLAPGWENRIGLHQLHPLAVHAAGHGPGYGSRLGSAARATLAL
ncbi:fructosamine kinase family protein [Williamsia phyllosphaerae]|nr:fructosamine kinase family protein [Williamsia phyllosphaerae]